MSAKAAPTSGNVRLKKLVGVLLSSVGRLSATPEMNEKKRSHSRFIAAWCSAALWPARGIRVFQNSCDEHSAYHGSRRLNTSPNASPQLGRTAVDPIESRYPSISCKDRVTNTTLPPALTCSFSRRRDSSLSTTPPPSAITWLPVFSCTNSRRISVSTRRNSAQSLEATKSLTLCWVLSKKTSSASVNLPPRAVAAIRPT
jgi:hypothetical protein